MPCGGAACLFIEMFEYCRLRYGEYCGSFGPDSRRQGIGKHHQASVLSLSPFLLSIILQRGFGQK